VTTDLVIRDIHPAEHEALGRLMVGVYSRLDGFPTPAEQPRYYELLANIGRFTEKPGTRVLVALTPGGDLAGGIVYFGGIATSIADASGIRLLGVDPRHRNAGVGKALANACIRLARESGHAQVILHTTQAMQVAWGLYERLGFVRDGELDFAQEGLPVFGFRLSLRAHG
jgi:ribosomal protein S18 acetylase RimI-like enzyme